MLRVKLLAAVPDYEYYCRDRMLLAILTIFELISSQMKC